MVGRSIFLWYVKGAGATGFVGEGWLRMIVFGPCRCRKVAGSSGTKARETQIQCECSAPSSSCGARRRGRAHGVRWTGQRRLPTR